LIGCCLSDDQTSIANKSRLMISRFLINMAKTVFLGGLGISLPKFDLSFVITLTLN
jgi:hypothetical protein